MKQIRTKIPAMIGMIFSACAILFLIKILAYIFFSDLLHDGTSFYDPWYEAWQCMISVLMYSILGLIFFVIDAILSAIKAVLGIDRHFHLVLSVVTVVGIPLAIMMLLTPMTLYKDIFWCSYYLLLLTAQIVSVIRCIKQRPKKEKQPMD